MDNLHRLFPTSNSIEWQPLNVSNGIDLISFNKKKIKGKQYARPFFIWHTGITKKIIRKMFKNIIKQKPERLNSG